VARFVLLALCVSILACAPSTEAPLTARDAGADAGESIGKAVQEARPILKLPRTPPETSTGADEIAKRFPAYGIATHYMANIYGEPKTSARVIGYMRRGALFRAGEEVTRKGCARGWFAVAAGYVCNGEGTWIDSRPRTFEPSPLPAMLAEALPYRYGKIVAADVLEFQRAPTATEEQAAHAALAELAVQDAGVTADGGSEVTLPALVRARMEPGFYVSLDERVDPQAPSFTKTVRGTYVRADRLIPAQLPAGKGVALGGRLSLPIAFVYRGGAQRLIRDPLRNELVKAGEDLPLYGVHALTGETISKGNRHYFVTIEGLYLRDTAVRVVERTSRPAQVRAHERWIRVDLDRQTLTAYEGDEPVFATLVSSGLPDHATPTGLFRLHAKHVTATMADDRASDGPYRIEDVPWTMYFQGSYALHAAFWHDRFGHQRSHGCVNLAPRDARWLFFWTLPVLPNAWHGVLAKVGEGTPVLIHATAPSTAAN
jgi:hypothetical protein